MGLMPVVLLDPESVNALPILGPNGLYYEMVEVPEKLTWLEARAAASAATFGGMQGRLAEIYNQSVQDFLESNILPLISCSSNLAYGCDVWIGGFQPAGSPEPGGGWLWDASGRPLVFTNWDTGEPNDSNVDEDALEMIVINDVQNGR